MRPRSLRSSFWRMPGLFALLASTALADSIFLNERGRQNLEVIRARVAPAPIFEDAARRLSYIRCVIVAERPAREPSAPYDVSEGRPEYDFVAFDATGDKRSGTVALNGLWIHHIEADLDSELDVRALFSDRDRRAGVALASRDYFARARRAGDPAGKLGLWRNDARLPAEPAGVNEGLIVQFLLDPPVIDASGTAEKWSARKRTETLAAMKDVMTHRLPTSHLVGTEGRPSIVVPMLIDAIARERAYRLSRAGFDRTALAMLVFMLDLAAVRHREPPIGDDPADTIYNEGLNGVFLALATIEGAMPSALGHAEPPALAALLARYHAAGSETEKNKLAADYDALQKKFAAEARAICAEHRQFCIDSSQRAAAALDALAASEALYAAAGEGRRLITALLALQTDPTGPNPHKSDREDLRDRAFKLLGQLCAPPPSPHADRQQRRQACAQNAREELRGLVLRSDEDAGDRVVARRALAAAGWGGPDELHTFATTLLDLGMQAAESLLQEPEPERRPGWRAIAGSHLTTLRVLAGLAASRAAPEQAAASLILNRVEEMRRAQRDEQKTERRYAIFLEIWDSVAPPP